MEKTAEKTKQLGIVTRMIFHLFQEMELSLFEIYFVMLGYLAAIKKQLEEGGGGIPERWLN